MATRFGVDVGGTYTDLVFYDDVTGETRVAKGLTTPTRPDEGVLSVVDSGISVESVAAASHFLHGTTVGLNALLQRKGGRIALLTTEGFRDVLEMRRGTRGSMYDALWQPQAPLVPRRLRIPIRERMLADGTVHTPLDADEVKRAADRFIEEKIDVVAICFINGYANPAHEDEAAELLRKAGFKGEISTASQLTREYREYERSSTTVVDAFVRPVMSGYLSRLERELRDRSFNGDCLITRSGGGSMEFDEAELRPVDTIMSGPVAGAVGAGHLCDSLGIKRAITADVGGTSFDTCLVLNGRPTLKYEGMVGDMPVQTPWVDVRSIGSGGGSIAHVDEGTLLRVGPQSAGAEPGPVCYGRGGEQPTTTDAAAVLGMLAFGELADDISLDIEGSKRALESLGEKLGISVEEVASGIMTIASSAMASAIRSVTVEQGEDPRDAVIVAFGGAGPLFGTLLADHLDIDTVLVPPHAGNFSALGLLGQDITRDSSLTVMEPLNDEGLKRTRESLDTMFDEMLSRGGDDWQKEAALDLRYSGQEHSQTVAFANFEGEMDVAGVIRDFEVQYERTFGHTLNTDIDVVSARATLRRPLPQLPASKSSEAANSEARTIEAYSFNKGERRPFNVISRADLESGSKTPGPMIIVEPTATTYVDDGYTVTVDSSSTLFIQRNR